jgi:hypothetical protein
VARRPPGPNATSPWPFVGMAGMACVFFLYAVSGPAGAPWWAAVLLMVLWAALLFVATAWWTLHPTWVPGIAVTAMVVWVLVMVAGGQLLGWELRSP